MTQKYQVKVSMKQAAIVETGIVLKQGDFGMQIEIEVLDFDATGTTPQIVFRKAMGAVESTTITVSSNKYTYTFKGTELDTPGKVFCDLKLKNSTTQRISTASFMFRVVADTLDGLAEESSSYSDTIEQLLENTLQKSETAGLVKNDGSINTTIEAAVTNQGAQIVDLKSIVSYSAKLGATGIVPDVAWEQGSIDGNGQETVNSTRIRTGFIYIPENSLLHIIPIQRTFAIHYYDENKNHEGYSDRYSLGKYLSPSATKYIRIVQMKFDQSQNIIPSENNIEVIGMDSILKDQNMVKVNSGYAISGDDVKWGNFAFSDGMLSYIDTRVGMKMPISVSEGTRINVMAGTDQDFYWELLNESFSVIHTSPAWTSQNETVVINQNCYFIMTTRKQNNGVISTAERLCSFVVVNPFAANVSNAGYKIMTSWEQGYLDSDGVTELYNTTRIRMDDAQKVEEGSTIKILPNDNDQMFFYFILDANNNIIEKSSSWEQNNKTIIATKECYLRVVVRKTDSSNILPSEIKVDVRIYSKIEHIFEDMAKKGKYTYSGERLNFGNYSFNSEKVLHLSNQPDGAQCSFVCNDKLFIINLNTVYVYNYNTGSYITSFLLNGTEDNHSSSVTIAPNLHSGNSQYPYIYVSEFYGAGSLLVFEITESNGTFASTLVQTIKIDSLTTDKVGAGYADYVIDFLNNKLILMRYALANSTKAISGNYTIITYFELPDVVSGELSLSDADIIKSYTLYDLIQDRQQCTFYNGCIYILAGTGYKSYIYLICNNSVASKVWISDAIGYLEPEGIIIRDGGIVIVPNHTTDIYKLIFF